MPAAADVEKLRQRLLYDSPFWAEHCAVIRAENRQAVRLVPRPWQLAFDQALEKQRAAGQPMRAIVLKARKLGFSTWVQAKFMQRITQLEAQYAVVVGQDRATSGVLFDMAKLIYDRLPTDPMLADLIFGEGTSLPAPFSVRPRWLGGGETRSGSKWMALGSKARSSDASIYETRTAGSSGAGRGYTPSLIHASEVAHWEDPRFKVGLMESLPGLPETIAVFESDGERLQRLPCDVAERRPRHRGPGARRLLRAVVLRLAPTIRRTAARSRPSRRARGLSGRSGMRPAAATMRRWSWSRRSA
jgi:hypothetical protein